ncbi:MAG: UDP-N-acetyl-D-galactosamine dehydrogenase [Candidatus Magnetoglobus multicellularis str. Araruama]|uniref:UDP-N-acetyl-D-galactosamine dehydrogenase n=1 Tax=Candidatus Magnetoglobus multicellularis str. Araruama TaxID=890399 RepID=A0A1V1PB24_9BACT|nr:MAG: UDP-N-acetyl-D-galactosamine dehydrogenase [Candidatus Magnetoglobus multicellularis str. Araruama]
MITKVLIDMKLADFQQFLNKEKSIAVVGLGYVGLPLSVHLARHFNVVGFDIQTRRIKELNNGIDKTREVDSQCLKQAGLTFTDVPETLESCSIIIIAVPTPIDSARIPDLSPLRNATAITGQYMQANSVIVYESTVYPGATEDVCVPILEECSGMAFGQDFTVGYSPERINPGDRERTLDKIIKVVSASDHETLALLSKIYGQVVHAGIHQAPTIKVAEAAKVIENTQRDINIALMNELSMIFNRMNINTQDVLKAARTKWNFLPFHPGLVGGHCIGVDPYYLTFKAESLGYHPDMILAGRRINDGMGKYIAERTVKMIIATGKPVMGAKVAVLGLTFKEDVPDLRNTKVIDIINELKEYGLHVHVHDPYAEPSEAFTYLNLSLTKLDDITGVNAVIIAVKHRHYFEMGLERISQMCISDYPLIVDVKNAFAPNLAQKLGIMYWCL